MAEEDLVLAKIFCHGFPLHSVRLDLSALHADRHGFLDLLEVPGDPLSATGLSFAPLVRGAADVTRVGSAERVRFTETDIRVLPRTDGGGIDEEATARHNAQFIEVDPQSGRMHVRQHFVPLVLAQKERAAARSRWQSP